MNEKKRDKLRASRVFIAMGIIVVTLFGADGLRRGLESQKPYNLKVQGVFRDNYNCEEPSTGNSLSYNAADPFGGVENTAFSECELSKEDVSKGLLAIYTESKPAKESDQTAMVKLIDRKNEYYTLCEEDISLNADAANALNTMMEDYQNETSLADFIVYGTTETYTGDYSYCPKEFSESMSGYCIDLALNAGGTVLSYDGCDAEGWIVENCWRYGFIVRCPDGKKEKNRK
jgi:D-alanyl-D-alanine carboxypeptidase